MKENKNLLYSRFLKILITILAIFLIIFIGTQITFIFSPLVVFIQTLFIPFLIAGVLFYLLRPIVNKLHKQKIPYTMTILIIYILFIGLVALLVIFIGPILHKQITNLVNDAPKLFNDLRNMLVQLENNEWISRFQQSETFSFEEITTNLTNYLYEAFNFVTENISNIIGVVTNVILILILVPFILFYLLKDGSKAPNYIIRFLPEKHQEEGHRILKDMDEKLSSYIQGQIIVSFCVGVLMYIAFLIIGVDYSLILALVTMVANVVPFVGPWIGTIPAVIVAVIDSFATVLWVILAIIIVQQIESNLISPQVMGKKLAIHPLTIIVLILVAGKFAGLLGLILAVPFYAVTKVIISHIYRLYKLSKKIDNN